ncbi:dienelactone hydrolase family protein [Nonomuraea sp. NPDC049695]|uniref:dienelactone hydrolase family protein n=1 Tax=Nonomuraea sp. NPDC049695 TaxID=3154734 RepID=UPI00343EF0AB
MHTYTEIVHADGRAFKMPMWVPRKGTGPGLLMIHEIFGVGPYIWKVAEDLAALGYVVGLPDLFWRLPRNWTTDHEAERFAPSSKRSNSFDFRTAVTDCEAALNRLSRLPQVTGRTGLMGFCLGGSLAYAVAAVSEPTAVVSFYGSLVPDLIEILDPVACPLQFHFGGNDPYIPRHRVAVVQRAAARQPLAEVHVQENAGHAFHNFEASQYYNAQAANAAWRLTTNFLSSILLQ